MWRLTVILIAVLPLWSLSAAHAAYVGLLGTISGVDPADLLDGPDFTSGQSRPAMLYLSSSPADKESTFDLVSQYDRSNPRGGSDFVYNELFFSKLPFSTYDLHQQGFSFEVTIATQGGPNTATLYKEIDFNGQTTRQSTVLSPFSFDLTLDRRNLIKGGDSLYYDLATPLVLDLDVMAGNAASHFQLSASQLQIYGSSITAVPLPASAPLFGAALIGLVGLGSAARLRKQGAL